MAAAVKALLVLALIALVALAQAAPPTEFNVEQPRQLSREPRSTFDELVEQLDDILDGRQELPKLNDGVAVADEIEESELPTRQKRACRRIVIISRYGRKIVIIKC